MSEIARVYKELYLKNKLLKRFKWLIFLILNFSYL